MSNIKLCIFDVDGVLVNSRELHYPATASALSVYGCDYSRDEDEYFGTIPTREKLHLLAKYDRIDFNDIESIWQLKDEYACRYFNDRILINHNIKDLFKELKRRDILIALGSNARFSFLNKVIDALDIDGLVDYIASAQDMIPKPDPYMYNSVMKKFEILPENTVIFEDSEVGKRSAYDSGAFVYEVESYDELSVEILNKINSSSCQSKSDLTFHRKLSRANHLLH